jgi:anti-anti-sigma factor
MGAGGPPGYTFFFNVKEGATAGLSWTIDDADGCVAVTVVGELDMARCGPLEDALLATAGEHRVEFDLSGLKFMDSSGVRCLLNVRAAVEASGGTVALREMSPVVERVLDVTGTLPLFTQGDPSGDDA